jgi:putative intracellular protease/amidase
MKVLMVLTSHDQLGNTGRKTGFWLEELAAPYFVFKDAGVDITLASPKGGQPPLDPKSKEPMFQTDRTHRFEADAAAEKQLSSTLKLDSVRQEDYDTLFYPGGHGPMWDLAEDPNSVALTREHLVEFVARALGHRYVLFAVLVEGIDGVDAGLVMLAEFQRRLARR